MELEHLARTLLSTDPSSALNSFKEKIKAYTCGQLLHAKDVLPALYDIMGKNKPFDRTPAPPSAPPKGHPVGGDWERLKDALTSSLTSGSFLDSQFYALDSRPPTPGAPKIRPIYFCSMAGGTFLSRLVKCELSFQNFWDFAKPLLDSSRIWPSGKTRLQCVDGYDSEIDDEDLAMGVPIDSYPRSTWCVNFIPWSKLWIQIGITSIPEDPLPTYKAPAPALVLKSGTART